MGRGGGPNRAVDPLQEAVLMVSSTPPRQGKFVKNQSTRAEGPRESHQKHSCHGRDQISTIGTIET